MIRSTNELQRVAQRRVGEPLYAAAVIAAQLSAAREDAQNRPFIRAGFAYRPDIPTPWGLHDVFLPRLGGGCQASPVLFITQFGHGALTADRMRVLPTRRPQITLRSNAGQVCGHQFTSHGSLIPVVAWAGPRRVNRCLGFRFNHPKPAQQLCQDHADMGHFVPSFHQSCRPYEDQHGLRGDEACSRRSRMRFNP